MKSALVVACALPDWVSASESAADGATLDPTKLMSWMEIRSDGRILVRTGRGEMGTVMDAFYRQMVAEELDVRPDSIDLIMADTDRTPDGGWSAAFLQGTDNLRRVSVYVRQALLGLASVHLAVPAASLDVADGVVSARGASTDRSVSYADLV